MQENFAYDCCFLHYIIIMHSANAIFPITATP